MDTIIKRITIFVLVLKICMSVAACTGGTARQTEPDAQTKPSQQDVLRDPVQTIFKNTGDLLSKADASDVGTVGGEWVIIGLSRSDRLSKEVSDVYIQAAGEYVQSVGSCRLHRAKCTDNARMILALTAVGGDVTNVGGFNLLEGLTEMDYLTKQGNNGPIWALIALDCGDYEIPVAENADQQVSRERLVDYILSVQCADGGWGLTGDAYDIDITAMALQALADYRKDEKVASAVEKALVYLSNAQSVDGGYVGYGISTSESGAQVIVALTALGIDPDTDSRFVKNGSSVLDALCGFAVDGGGFCHLADFPEANGVATEQGYYALTAYWRFLSGKTSLYDINE